MKQKRLRVGIVGCGAIGSRIAKSVTKELKKECQLTGLFDRNLEKSEQLAKQLKLKTVVKNSLEELLRDCDLLIEAVSSSHTRSIIKTALQKKKSVLAMSVGKLLNATYLFKLAKKNKCALLLPSGAIAGIDAIKAASLVKVKKITLTTRKPPAGLKDNPYFEKRGINLNNLKKETTVFKGNVRDAVKHFPQNINVAATIALALQSKTKFLIQIITSPKYKRNSHEIVMEGDFGRITTKTENLVCPDNPKTSYLAVLSGIQTLRQYCSGILIGT